MLTKKIPKLWCRYEFIVHNHLWNSEIAPQLIQKKISKEGYRNGLSKTALEFKNCKQQLFTLTMCLPTCLWAKIGKTSFNYTITAQTRLAKCDDYQFQRLILQFPALGKKYRIASISFSKLPYFKTSGHLKGFNRLPMVYHDLFCLRHGMPRGIRR